RAQRENVTGPRQILGPRVRIDCDQNRRRAIGCGDAGADAATGVDGNCESGAEIRRVVGHLRRQVELVTTFFCKWETNQTTGMTGHEIDDFGSDLLSRADEIAFILTIFVVNDDDHPAVADLSDGFVDSRNRHDGMLTETTRPRKGTKSTKFNSG